MTKKRKEISLGDIPKDFNWDKIDGIVFTSAEPPDELEEFTNQIENSYLLYEDMEHMAPPDLGPPIKEIKKEYIKKPIINTKENKKNIVRLNDKYSEIEEKSLYSAFELLNLNIKEVPKLVDPLFQKTGLASLVGTSDTGKSTFLRQLALSIVLKKEKFLDFKLNFTHGKVIYVSTEDGAHSIGSSIKKQIESIKHVNDDLKLLENLKFILDTDKLFLKLNQIISKEPVDLIIMDAFTDIFTKELNSNTQVRTFLNVYDNLAKKNNCLIIFLHHTGKRTQHNSPSKDSIIGSQGFEAKMRAVIEIKPNKNNAHQKDLWILKSNFLEPSVKKNSYLLNFSDDMVFTNSGIRGSVKTTAKSNNLKLKNKILELHKAGHSFRKIEKLLKGTDFEISKTAANNLIKEHKKGGN
jgi:KaiC/GvpD/RAD55 family RecA-like ATPase